MNRLRRNLPGSCSRSPAADLPPFATFLGKGWIEAGAAARFIPVLVLCSGLVGGAVLRVAGGVFYGLGDRPTEDLQMADAAAEETSETTGGRGRTPLTMIVPPALLVVAAIGVGLIGRLGPVVRSLRRRRGGGDQLLAYRAGANKLSEGPWRISLESVDGWALRAGGAVEKDKGPFARLLSTP